jgi:hypothetical protein
MPPILPFLPLARMHIDSPVHHGSSYWLAHVPLPVWYPSVPTLSLPPIGSYSGQFAPVPVYSLVTYHTQHSLLHFSSRKMELIPSSETSTHLIQTPGIYPKQHQQHGESLKTKIQRFMFVILLWKIFHMEYITFTDCVGGNLFLLLSPQIACLQKNLSCCLLSLPKLCECNVYN